MVVDAQHQVRWRNARATALAAEPGDTPCFVSRPATTAPCPGCPLEYVLANGMPCDTPNAAVCTPCGHGGARLLPLTGPGGDVLAVAVIGLPSAAGHGLLDADLFRELVEVMNDGLGVQDTEGRLVYVNTRLCRILGYAPEDLIGQRGADYVWPEDRAFFEEQVRQRREGVALSSYEISLRHRDGHRVHARIAPQALYDAHRRVKGTFAVTTDITQRKLAEEAVARSEERFRTILENSRDIAYKLDVATRTYEYISPSVTAITGYAIGELAALGFDGVAELVHPEDRGRFEDHYLGAMALAAARLPATFEFRFRHRNGEYLWLSDSATAVRDGEGGATAIVGAIRDVTAQRRAEEALRAASRLEATATLAGGVAHDFNNLMASVLGNAELLEHMFQHAPDAQPFLREIAEAAQRAGDLTHQLLAYAREGKYQPRPLCLNARVRQVLTLEKAALPRGVTIVEDLAGELWPVEADEGQMDQVVVNVTMNAVEATDPPGAVEVSTRNVRTQRGVIPGVDAGNYVRLRVRDAGPGMDDATRERMFDPFFSTKLQGRGLGLAAVYGIVKNHGGAIHVQSEPGRGTCVDVYLPANGQQEAPEGAIPAEAAGAAPGVLLIDDEDAVRTVTRRLLERQGYRVTASASVREALAALSAPDAAIDVVLLDVRMPDGTVHETLPVLQATRPGVPVILCTGCAEEDVTVALAQPGACGFIQKPFKIGDLHGEIRRVLGR